MDILDLPGWRLLEAPLDGEGYRLVAEFLAEPDTVRPGRLPGGRPGGDCLAFKPLGPGT